MLEDSTRQGRKNLKDMLTKGIIIPAMMPFTHHMTGYKVEEHMEQVEGCCAPKGRSFPFLLPLSLMPGEHTTLRRKCDRRVNFG